MEDDDISYYEELAADERREEQIESFLEDCADRTLELLKNCGYDPDKHDRVLLSHIFEATDRLRLKLIHNPENRYFQQMSTNLAEIGRKIQEEHIVNEYNKKIKAEEEIFF
jgi:hypothetical protein